MEPAARSRVETAWLRLSTGKDEEYFFENLAMLLASGIDVTTALSSLEKSVRSRAMKSIITGILSDVDAGTALSTAIGRQHLLPEQSVQLLHIGEESGSLVESLTVIVNQIRKDKILRAKIASAMLYPAFVFGLTLVVGIGIAWFVLPNLSQVFSRLNVTLPIFTVILIAIGNFLGAYGIIFVPAFILALVILGILFATVPVLQQLGQSVLFLLPGAHTIVQDVELARFGYIVGSLLSAGLPFPQALDLLSESSGFYRYKRFYRTLRDRVEEGNTLTKSIAAYPHNTDFVPVPFQELISASERSGKLAATLTHIGELSEAKTDIAANNLAVLMEPILLVIVWLGVLWVAVSVIVPIYSLIGGLNAVTP